MFFSYFKTAIESALIFFGWSDLVEISFFSLLIYYFSLWLSTDTKKNLLLGFYGFWALLFASYALELHAIVFFLSMSAPISLILLIIIHQDFLQKNFITITNKPRIQSCTGDWLESLIRICLQTLNKNKEITILIENNDSLETLLSVPFTINTPFDQTFIRLLIDAHSFDQHKYIWLNSQGIIKAINGSLKTVQATSVEDTADLLQEALMLTHKTDTVMVTTDLTKRTFTIIAQSEILENLPAATAIKILKKYLLKSEKGVHYGYIKNYNEKHLSS